MRTRYATVSLGVSLGPGGATRGFGVAQTDGFFYTFDSGGGGIGVSTKYFPYTPNIGYGVSKSSILDLTGESLNLDVALGIGVQFSAGLAYQDITIPLTDISFQVPYFSGKNSGQAGISVGGSLTVEI